MAKKKVSIIGGGMSGLVGAIMLARQGHKVTVFEKNNKIGKKLLVTGNGRCNISNENVSASSYHSMSHNLFDSIYQQFNLLDTKKWFESIGIDFIQLDNGKLYPRSLQAKSVVQALLMELERYKVDIVYKAAIKHIEYKGKYIIRCNEKTYYSQYIIIATGGRSYSDSGSNGDGYLLAKAFSHQLTPTYPSIVQLKTDYFANKELKGLKALANVTLIDQQGKLLARDYDEVLFTDYGLSGPSILQVSSYVEPRLSNGEKLRIQLDLVPDMDRESLDHYLIARFHKFSYRMAADALVGFMNQRLIRPILVSSNIEPTLKAGDITKVMRQDLIENLKAGKHTIVGTYLWNQAQVTKGGVNCNEVFSHSLESKHTVGMYFVGEVLDMDGNCGGFNLQWAISSAAVAAMHIDGE